MAVKLDGRRKRMNRKLNRGWLCCLHFYLLTYYDSRHIVTGARREALMLIMRWVT